MDVPEIRAMVARLLDKSGLIAAALVCKNWNATVTPILYSGVYLDPSYTRKYQSVLGAHVANAHHIRHLEFTEDQVPLFSHCCTKLKSIWVRTESSWDSERSNHLYTLVQSNPGITSLKIQDGGSLPPKRLLAVVSSTCSSLRHLSWECGLDAVCLRMILDKAVHLEALTINSPTIPLLESLDKWPCFSSLSALHMTTSKYTSAQFYLEIVRRCPVLRDLSWRIGKDDPCPISDISSVFKAHCSRVERLMLSAPHLKDKDISEIMDYSHRFVSVGFQGSCFGELAFRSLSRHFATLQELDLSQCPEFTSSMAQRVMTSCSKLISFSATTLKAGDILGDVKEEVTGLETVLHGQPQDWVCKNLESLAVFICGLRDRPPAWDRKVLQQLAKLTRLKRLTISRHFTGSRFTHDTRDGLDLRLKTGLGALSTLNCLEYLGFKGLRQQMENQDVIWVMKSWPALKHMMGKLHYDPERQRHLRMVLDKKIYTPSYGSRSSGRPILDLARLDIDDSDIWTQFE